MSEEQRHDDAVALRRCLWVIGRKLAWIAALIALSIAVRIVLKK
jgi:hypothetical protein